MSQHRQPTYDRNLKIVVVAGWVTTALVFTATMAIATAGPDITGREVVGVGLGMCFSITLFSAAWDRHHILRHRRADAAAQRAAAALAASRPSPRALTLVRTPVPRLGTADTQRLDLP